MSGERVARIRQIVSRWDESVLDEARELEQGLAEAAADALVDAMIDLDTDSMAEALAEAPLTPAEEQLRAVATMEQEVSSGGFQQFLDSCGREEAELAADGCARIGAPVFERIAREVLDLVPVVPDDEWPQDLVDALAALDERFYDGYEEVEGLLRLRLAYGAEHPEEFRGLRGG